MSHAPLSEPSLPRKHRVCPQARSVSLLSWLIFARRDYVCDEFQIYIQEQGCSRRGDVI